MIMMNKKIARIKEYVWTGDSDESVKRYNGGTFMWAIEYESPYNVCDRECFYVNDMFTQIIWKDIPQVIRNYVIDATIVDVDTDCIDVRIYTYESNKDTNVQTSSKLLEQIYSIENGADWREQEANVS